jgi:aminoglycoside phosphotransferase (APT) family kinase protein
MTRDEVVNFLVKHQLADRGIASDERRVQVTALTGGVSSDIVRVDLDGQALCLKRALPTLKVARYWAADVRRSLHEIDWLRAAHRIVPTAVPPVLAADEELCMFAMPFLDARSHPLWKSELLAGRVHRGFASSVAAVLAALHGATAADTTVAQRFAHHEDFAALRLDPYLGATAAAHPTLSSILLALRERTARTRLALIHGDVSPKNILRGPHGPVILDAECACHGDPAFDVAFLLNHLFLKCLVNPGVHREYLDEARDACSTYESCCTHEPWSQMQLRVATLLPALMLARVDGLSPVEYLGDEARKNLVRSFARDQLVSAASTLPGILDRWHQAVSSALLRVD